MKKEEHDRRATLKSAKHELEQEIAELELRVQSSSELDAEDQEKLKKLEEQHQKVAERVQNQRLILVEKNLADKQRKSFRLDM